MINNLLLGLSTFWCTVRGIGSGIVGSQHKGVERPVRSVFLNYLSVSYDYAEKLVHNDELWCLNQKMVYYTKLNKVELHVK